MKAAVRTKYGLPGDVCIREVEIPVPKADEVLIKVFATTVNRSDCHVLSGRPFVMRLFTGLWKPRRSIIGSDFSGRIEATGSNVKNFTAGSRIMGFGGAFGCGAHAQYFTMAESKAVKSIVSRPNMIDDDETAACLEGAVYACSFVLQLNIQPGQKALVYGATGAIGSACVQFLKSYGVGVTAACGGENAELVRRLGADKIIDYRKEDFTKDEERYDYVFDAVGKTSFLKCRPLLKDKGLFSSAGGAINLLWVLVTPLFGGKKVLFPKLTSIRHALEFIKDQVEKGKFKPLIDKKYPLEKIAEAYKYVASGQKLGNVVIAMDE
ncbi:MAG: NAD(P)-dependent alcohol dehydrogenase [Flavisolibacter sp.]